MIGSLDWFQAIVAGIISTSSVIAAAAFIGREWLKRLLSRSFERFRHELQLDATTRQLTLKSQIDFKERQIAEFYGPIGAADCRVVWPDLLKTEEGACSCRFLGRGQANGNRAPVLGTCEKNEFRNRGNHPFQESPD
jgi:hypothetical protein